MSNDSIIQNKEQRRAAHALDWSGKIAEGEGGGDPSSVVKQVTSQVGSCGLLPAMAFAVDKGGYRSVFEAYLCYRKDLAATDKDSLKEYLETLCEGDSASLRLETNEFMAYINYLRRFVK